LAAGLLTIAERPVALSSAKSGSGAEDNLTGSLEMPMARRLGLADLMSYIDGRRIAPFGIARVLIVKEGP
jgi:hypothetical protein